MSLFRPAIRPARGDPMSFELRLGRHVSTEIKRIATEQTSTALAELREIERSCHDYEQFAGVVDEAVHTTRKALKKTRATLRLVRNELGEEVYQRENASYRDAGRALSEMRDVYVRAQTLGGMRESLADQDIEGAVAEIQAMLANRHRAHRRQLFEERGPVEEAIALIESAQRRIKAWPIREDAYYMALRDGLRRTYKRGRRRMRDAYEHPAPDRFHEWRKRVKYHWRHMRILKQLWPKVLRKVGNEAHAAVDFLGDAHYGSVTL